MHLKKVIVQSRMRCLGESYHLNKNNAARILNECHHLHTPKTWFQELQSKVMYPQHIRGASRTMSNHIESSTRVGCHSWRFFTRKDVQACKWEMKERKLEPKVGRGERRGKGEGVASCGAALRGRVALQLRFNKLQGLITKHFFAFFWVLILALK